jgi:nitrite reductase/ring-hydroxylating ferredoxin subunit
VQRYVVCRKEDLRPGDTWVVTAGGRRIAVACVEDGSYRAVADTCPHEMGSLAKGKVEQMWVSHRVGDYRASESRCVIVCPWHNFEFDLDTGLSVCEPDRLRIKVYRVSLEHDKVVVFI